MSAPTEEFDRPCPHGGSFVTCNDCLTEYMAVERWVDDGHLDNRPEPEPGDDNHDWEGEQ